MTVRSAIDRRGPAVVTMAIGAVVTIAGSLLPWVRSGSTRRNSYDLLSLVERLGFAAGGPAETALRWWPVIPLLATAAVIAAWWGWPRIGGTAGVLAALYGGGVALAVIWAPSDVVHTQLGARLTVIGAAVLAGGSIGAVVVGWRATSASVEEPLSSTGHGR